MAYDKAPIQCFVVEADGEGNFRRDGGDWLPMSAMPVGAMYYADWMQRKGPDGHRLFVLTPGGLWSPDGRASNCTRPEDNEHHCWVRHGTPPNITVDKNGDTCGCGCSIGQGPGYSDYHGFLRNGVLEAC
jgi:hypothetical protein